MKLKGIKIPHNKTTQFSKTLSLDLPKKVYIPLLQNMGAECEPVVDVGDIVFVGQKIADSGEFMSTPVHSSVSGKVTAINTQLLPNGRSCKVLEIRTDGQQTVSGQVVRPHIINKESFVHAIRESGSCGLGGAGFPTHVKFRYDEEKTPIDTLVINAAECEPYITSDYREMIENPEDIVDGIKQVLKYLKIEKAMICIEDNKPQAIKKLLLLTHHNPQIHIVSLKTSYPQGAEKLIVFSATGRIVKEGELPSNQGAIVLNVSTVSFIGRYLRTGMPLIEKRITVDGDAVSNPINVFALMGTPVSKLLDFAKADKEAIKKLIAGGPMMGTCLIDTETPVVKTYNAILALKNDKKQKQPTACIRCGICMRACPMNLMPMELEKAYDVKNADLLNEQKIMLCMNCGSCSYACPASRKLSEKFQLAKGLIPKK